MKSFKIMLSLLFAVLVSLLPNLAQAQVYAYTNPTYLPTAIAQPATYTAPAAYVMSNQGIGTVGLRVAGTCTSLAAVAQVSLDNTNWTTVNVYPVTTSTVTPAASISAPGVWRINTAGMAYVRLSITALTASCSVQMVGTQAAFTNLF